MKIYNIKTEEDCISVKNIVKYIETKISSKTNKIEIDNLKNDYNYYNRVYKTYCNNYSIKNESYSKENIEDGKKNYKSFVTLALMGAYFNTDYSYFTNENNK